jgi:hypothetical protein
VKIPGRVSDVVRSLAGSGVAAAVAFFFTRARCPIDGGRRLSSTRRFTRNNGFNRMGIAAADLGEGMVEQFSRVGVREPDHRFDRRLIRYPALTGAGNKVAVT